MRKKLPMLYGIAAAFIVMGTHTRGFVKRTVSGSVAEDVLQLAGRAVVSCRVADDT